MTTHTSIEGTIAISKARKLGFVKHPETGNDVAIPFDDIAHALPGDTVRVSLTGAMLEDMPLGKVEAIITRNKMKFVGVVKKDAQCFVFPDSPKMYVDLMLRPEDCANVAHDDKVFVEIVSWEVSEKNPTAKVLENIGKKGVHEVEMRAIVLEKGFDASFPKNVLQEADNLKKAWATIPESEIAKRRDMRGTTTFTIDPADAKDFDDALSFKKLPNGNYEVGVHIADVSHYVTPGTALDKEGFERSFSVYLVDRTIPMLPEVLSNDLCSLNPEEEKLAFSAIFEMTPQAGVVSEWFGRTVIKSDKRFTYESAQRVLDDKAGDFAEELLILQDLAHKLADAKTKAGAIRFTSEEFEFELDPNGVPLKIVKKEHLDTHSLIEDFMLLANKHVAKYIFDACKRGNGGNVCSLMYRVHNVPDRDKIAELSVFLKALGYTLPVAEDGTISAKDLNALFAQVAGKAEESLVTSASVKTMSKALYSTENTGHFGLAFEYYTHFTSPIRRYPDLVVHRILQSLLDGGSISPAEAAFFEKAASHASQQEIAAQEAERASIRYKQVEFMRQHVGESFDGVISGVAPFGLFVALKDTGAEGMVHISKLGKDFWNLDEKNYRILGEKTKQAFTLGQQIRVKIESADLDQRKLNLVLA
ncbi:MAG: ribonuclease [Candidatus Parcubacteria bacterium]|jgi:ribonuclease R